MAFTSSGISASASFWDTRFPASPSIRYGQQLPPVRSGWSAVRTGRKGELSVLLYLSPALLPFAGRALQRSVRNFAHFLESEHDCIDSGRWFRRLRFIEDSVRGGRRNPRRFGNLLLRRRKLLLAGSRGRRRR